MPTVTRNDVVRLLALAAHADQRTVGEEDITLWHAAGRLHRWTFAAAHRVVVEHYSAGAGRPRITPAEISDRLRAIRAAALVSFDPPRIPDQLAAADYPRWLRAQRDRHAAAIVQRWAVESIDPPLALAAVRPDPIAQRRLAELTAGAFTAIGASPIDDPGDTRRREAQFERTCPHCRAEPGQPCTRSSAAGKRARLTTVHPSRLEATP